MSIRVIFQDGSSEKLLADTLTDEGHAYGEDDSKDKSLDSLLGINKKDVINLDEDQNDAEDIENPVSRYVDDINTKDDDGVEETTENEESNPDDGDADDVREIEPDVNNEECEAAEETHDGNDEPYTEKKKRTPVDFNKLFGRDLDVSFGNQAPTPGTSTEDFRVRINDDHEHENDSDKLRLLIPPSPNRNDSVRPVSAAVYDRRQIERKLLKKQISQRGKLVCGIFVTLLMLCLSLGLLALGWWFKIQDLYLVGGIFGGGTVIFFLIFIFIRCTSNTSVDYVTLYKLDSPQKKF